MLKRPSPNNFLKGTLSRIRLWIFEEENAKGERVLSYESINVYIQGGTTEKTSMKRVRKSNGYVIKSQYNTMHLCCCLKYTKVFTPTKQLPG